MDAATAWAYAVALLVVVGGILGAAGLGWGARTPTVDALRGDVADLEAELERLRALLADAQRRATSARDRAQDDADAARARADVVAGDPAGPDDARERAERLLSAAEARARAAGGPGAGGGPAG